MSQIIWHPGDFRVSFDDDGEDDFINPVSYGSFYSNSAVLLDDIPIPAFHDPAAVTITLPDIECQNCTLQVLEVLADRPLFQAGNPHYRCADLELVYDTSSPTVSRGEQERATSPFPLFEVHCSSIDRSRR